MSSYKILGRNWRLCIMLDMLLMAYLANATVMLYYRNILHFSPSQIFDITATVSATTLLSIVGFGYLADHLGVKTVMVIGGALRVGQSLIYVTASSYFQIWLAVVMVGLARAATSDLTNATMTFSMGHIRYEQARERLYERFLRHRAVMASGVSYAVAVLVGSTLTMIGGLRLPIVVQPVIEVAFVLTACLLAQPPQPTTSYKRLPHKLIRKMFIDRRDIRSLIFLTAIVEASLGMGSVLVQPRLKMTVLPEWSFAGFYALWAVGTAVGAKVALARSGKRDPYGMYSERRDMRLWTLTIAALTIGLLAAGLSRGLIGAFVLLIGLSLSTSLIVPLSRAFLRRALAADMTSHNADLSIATLSSLALTSLSAFCFGRLVGATSTSVGMIVVAAVCGCLGGGMLRVFKKSL